MNGNDKAALLAMCERAIEAEDAATRRQRVLERFSAACAHLWPSGEQSGAERPAEAQDAGRLPPEAIASMPAGYKAAPWIVEGANVPDDAAIWLMAHSEWSMTPFYAGKKSGPNDAGNWAVPIDTPDPREVTACVLPVTELPQVDPSTAVYRDTIPAPDSPECVGWWCAVWDYNLPCDKTCVIRLVVAWQEGRYPIRTRGSFWEHAHPIRRATPEERRDAGMEA